MRRPYPEIGDVNFKGALWTFKQQLAWKNVSVLWNFYSSPVNVFVLWLSGYDHKARNFLICLDCVYGKLMRLISQALCIRMPPKYANP